MKTGVWLHEKKLNPDMNEGFVYAVLIHSRGGLLKYFGKKRYWRGGKTGLGRPSDWKKYSTSSKLVSALIKAGAPHHAIILGEYKTRSGMSWGEVWTQAVFRVVERADCLNERIDSVYFKVKEPISDQHKRLVDELMRDPHALIKRLEE